MITKCPFSNVFLRDADFSAYLAAIRRDPVSGAIIGAGATEMRFFGAVNTSAISKDEDNIGFRGQPVRDL